MRALLVFVTLWMCGVNGEGRGYEAKNRYKAVTYSKSYVYYGKYGGKCSNDGLYFRNDESFVICTNGNSYVQPCAPGTRNSKFDSFSYGTSYAPNDFCSVNLVDYGYGAKKTNSYGEDDSYAVKTVVKKYEDSYDKKHVHYDEGYGKDRSYGKVRVYDDSYGRRDIGYGEGYEHRVGYSSNKGRRDRYDDYRRPGYDYKGYDDNNKRGYGRVSYRVTRYDDNDDGYGYRDDDSYRKDNYGKDIGYKVKESYRAYDYDRPSYKPSYIPSYRPSYRHSRDSYGRNDRKEYGFERRYISKGDGYDK